MKEEIADEEDKSLLSRVVALMLCVPIFELSLYLGLALALGSGRRALEAFVSLPGTFHIVYLGVAAATGLSSGMSGLVDLLGHLFLTHPEAEKSLVITLGAWGIIAGATVIAMALQ